MRMPLLNAELDEQDQGPFFGHHLELLGVVEDLLLAVLLEQRALLLELVLAAWFLH